jgi:hypothetical protein
MTSPANQMIDLTSDGDDDLQYTGSGKLKSDQSAGFHISL